MAACDQTSKYIQRVTVVAGGGAVPIVFPTLPVAYTQNVNGTVSAAVGDTTVLAANALRKFAQIVNVSGSPLFIAFGAAASALSLPLPNNGTFVIDANTLGQNCQQAVHLFNATGGALNVQVLEFV